MSDSTQIIFVTIQPGGAVDVQVRGSELSVQSYGRVLGVAARITANMFAQASGEDRKEVIRFLLKEINKSAHGSDDLNVQQKLVQ